MSTRVAAILVVALHLHTLASVSPGQTTTAAPTSSPAFTVQSATQKRMGLSDHFVSNCGMNATTFVLDYFGKEFDSLSISQDLKIGSNWERSASLGVIGQVLQKQGMAVEARVEATVDDIQSTLKGNAQVDAIVVAHVTLANGSGHFFILGRGSDDRLVVADPGNQVAMVDVEQLKNAGSGFAFSGAFLLVSAPTVTASGHKQIVFSLSSGRDWVDLGDVQYVASTKYSVPLSLVNDRSDGSLKIDKVTGSCGCFVGVRFNGGEPIKGESLLNVNAGQTVKAEIVFDADLFGAGRVERDVVISGTAGEKAFQKVIKVRANVLGLAQTKSASELPSLFPGVLAIDRVMRQGDTAKATLTVLLPKDVEIKNIKIKRQSLSIIGKTEVGTSLDGRREFEVAFETLLNTPLANDEEIVVELTGSIPQLEVKVRAR